MDVKKCTVCNIVINKKYYKKDINVCRNCYNINKKIYINNTFSRKDNEKKGKVINSVQNTNNYKKKKEVDDSVNKNNNRTLIMGFSNCGKTYLMNRILFQKQEPITIIT